MPQRRVLTQLPRDLSHLTGGCVTYRTIWHAAVEGRIAAMRGDNGRWTYQPEDLPGIAAALGLSASAQKVAA